ncbi:MAG: hypothetical protein HEEMFOPI_01721 [Holosporales bacterium]
MCDTKKELNMLSIRLSNEIENRLGNLAEKTGRTKSYYIRKIITENIDEIEDLYLSLSRIESPTKRWKQEDLEAGIDVSN